MKYIIRKRMVFIFIFIIVLISQRVFAKYFSKTTIDIEREISEPVINIEEDRTINLNHPNNTVYSFRINNFSHEKVNQIDLEYYIEIIVKKDENFYYKIYKEEKELIINKGKTNRFLLQKDIKQEDKWKIVIIFNSNLSQEILGEIRIKICYEQKEI